MKRLIAAVACTLALSLAAPADFVMPAAAQSTKSATKSAVKQCRAKAPNGKIVSWKCKSDQPCCMNTTTGQGVCGSPVIGCL